MTWANPSLLWGLALALIPILIYLLVRQRPPRIEWATMEFVLAALKKNRQRILFQTLLLLLVRTLLIAALVLLVARPILQGAWSLGRTGREPSVTVLILDDSCSTSASLGTHTVFERILDRAEAILDELGEGSAVAVIRAARPVRMPIPQPARELNLIREEIRRFTPRDSAADFAKAIDSAERILAAERRPNREVIILTDAQASDWRPTRSDISASLASLQKGPRPPAVLMVQVPGMPEHNAAVTDVAVESELVTLAEPVTFRVMVRNYGPDDLNRLPVDFLVDDRKVDGKQVDVPAEEDVSVLFTHRFRIPGPHAVTGMIGPDYLAADNSRVRIVQVHENIPVLLVDGRPEGERFRTATGFLQSALDPSGPGRTRGDSLLDVRVTGLRHLTDAELLGNRAVILAEIPGLTLESLQTLKRYVRAGGGLLFLSGGEMTPGEFDVLFNEGGKGLMPITLARPIALPSDADPFRLSITDRSHPAFRAFEHETFSSLLSQVGFRQIAGASGIHGERTETLGLFSNGEFALVENGYGAGRVLYFGSTAGRDAGDFPLNPAFVPFFRDMVLYLASSGVEEGEGPAGEPLTMTLVEEGDLTMIRPDGSSEPAGAYVVERSREGGRRLSYPDTGLAGVYRLQIARPDGIPRTILSSKNIPSGESRSDTVPASELETDHASAGLKVVPPEGDLIGTLHGARFGSEGWTLALIVVIGLFLLEAILARLFSPRAIDAEGMAKEAGRL